MKTKSTIKHILAVVLSLLMVFSVAIPAFAAGPYTITINNAEGLADMENGQFTAYQIFTGDVSGNTMVDVKWATGVDGNGLIGALKADSAPASIKAAFKDATTAIHVAEVLEKNTNAEFLQAFSKIAKAYLGTGVNSTKVSADVSTISVGAAGYYLIVQNSDIQDENGKNGVRSSFIMEVISSNTEVNLKADIPSVTKDIDDPNAAFGDYVQFTLTATLPNNFSDYNSYYLRFNDTLSAGLQLAIDATHTFEVKVDGKTVAAANYKTNAANEGVGSFYVTIANLKAAAFAGVTDKSTITVTYWAMVRTDAAITEINTVDLTYSNDPNNTGIPYDDPDEYPDGPPTTPPGGDPDDPNTPPGGPGTGTTVEDKEYVHNYKIDITKKGTDGKNLTGAKFYLIKDGKYATVANGKLTGWVDAVKDATSLVSADGKISVSGLDVGEYTLKEFEAADGYGTIDDVKFTISVTLSEDNSTIETLSATIEGTREDATVVSTDKETHVIALLLTDPTHSNLPSTGGIGTTIFYVVGGLMILGAAAYLVISKKKAKAQ
ncbi:MAG: isopeptide-forming domain-containing fimbrial protein [Eubacterium sp.]|nr:isopeptide-forming domain-containing fimbrial protein [Eubacterium sp.]